MDTPDPTYAGGASALIAHWEVRRAPIQCYPGEGLPLDPVLAAMALRQVPVDVPDLAKPASDFAKKRQALMKDLGGFSELAVLNGLVIAHLRKRDYPDHAPALFRRIWVEQAAALLAELPMRWLISSAITFADHGPTEADRHVGQSLNILFSVMKLYEFERQFSGTDAATPFDLGARRKEALPLGMPDFSLASGGLDINLLAPIWQAAKTAPAISPLACHLLTALNMDAGNLFRRINTMRSEKRKQLVDKAAKS